MTEEVDESDKHIKARDRRYSCLTFLFNAFYGNPQVDFLKAFLFMSRASICLSLSSTSSVTSQIRDVTAIEILVLTSWISHPRIFCTKIIDMESKYVGRGAI